MGIYNVFNKRMIKAGMIGVILLGVPGLSYAEKGEEEKEETEEVETENKKEVKKEEETDFKSMEKWVREAYVLNDVSEDKGFFREGRVTEKQFLSMVYRYLGIGEEETTEDSKDENKEEGKKEKEEGSKEEEVKGEAFKNGFPDVDTKEVYDKLRSVGIVGKGTNYENNRDDVLTIEEASTILISTFTEEEFITEKGRVENFLKEAGMEDTELSDWLDREMATKLLYQFHENGEYVSTEVVVDPELGSYETYYFGDWNKRLYYYYPHSGLMVGVSKLEIGLDKEKEYVKKITGEEIGFNEDKTNYHVTVQSLGSNAIDYYGYAVKALKGEEELLFDRVDGYVGLRGDSKLSTVVSGNGIEDLQVLLGENIVKIDLDDVEKVKKDRFIGDRGFGLEWNYMYEGSTVVESVRQIEDKLYKTHED